MTPSRKETKSFDLFDPKAKVNVQIEANALIKDSSGGAISREMIRTLWYNLPIASISLLSKYKYVLGVMQFSVYSLCVRGTVQVLYRRIASLHCSL